MTVGYLGNQTICEEKKDEFIARIIKILHQGGMFRKEVTQIHRNEITLLAPVTADKDNRAFFSYNYFEDRDYNTAYFDTEQASLVTSDVGKRVFNRILRAANVLREFYTEDVGIACADNRPFRAIVYIQWLNYLFQEQYTNQRVANLWDIYNLLPEKQHDVNLFNLYGDADIDRVPFSDAVRYIFFAVDRSITEMIDGMPESFEDTDSIVVKDGMLVFFRAVQRFHASSKKLGRLIELLTLENMPPDFIEDCDEMEQPIILFGSILPKEMVVKCVSEIFDVDAKEALQTWGARLHNAEAWTAIRAPFQPLPPLDTESFLALAHAIEPGSISDESVFLITDDDRAFYWQDDGDVSFSKEMITWMGSLRDELLEIQESEYGDVSDFPKLLVETLVKANDFFGQIYCFRDVFYDFLARSEDDPGVQAAIILLQRLVQRNITHISEDNQRNIDTRCHMGRLEVKRYLAILGNPELRKIVFNI